MFRTFQFIRIILNYNNFHFASFQFAISIIYYFNITYFTQNMCVTFFCLKPAKLSHSGVQFVIGFNRDEKTQRNTLPLAPFGEDPNIYAGRDQISGGTWLGINIKTGIIVILTNYDLLVERYGKSRGKLVLSFLKTESYEKYPLYQLNQAIHSRLCEVLNQRQLYSAFNLVVYSIKTQSVFYICSQKDQNQPQVLQKNKLYGMCNGPLDELWQKTKHGLNKFQQIVSSLNDTNSVQSTKNIFFGKTLALLKDNINFDQNLEKEASIFINPYFSENEKAQRMTKSSFLAVVEYRQNQDKFIIDMKQVTYKSPDLQQSQVSFQKTIGKQLGLQEQKY